MPPTATALAAGGGSRPSNVPSTWRRNFSSSSTDGGSERRYASARKPEPIRNEADQVTLPSGSPTAISVEPPPTSITAIVPSTGVVSVRVAPTKASRASSSPESTVIGMPARGLHGRGELVLAVGGAADRGGGDGHDLLGADLARDPRLGGHDLRGLGDLLGGIAPPFARLLPIRVKARWVTSSRSRPPSTSATSSRVVLLPMSMQAQIKPWTAAPARGARRPRTPGTAR